MSSLSRTATRALAAAVTAMALGAQIGAARAADLSPAETRGRTIYHSGRSETGSAVSAYVAAARTTLPASAIPCVGCHGDDGLGRPERGVSPPNILWKNLTKAYGHQHDNGRRHPAFDEKSLAEAVARGHDPAGNALGTAMPRYTMSDADMEDLIAYLKRLGKDWDPGVDDSVIRLGTVIPTSPRLKGLGNVLKQLLIAFFDGVNQRGGVHGRRIELRVADHPDDTRTTLANVDRLIRKDEVFALISPLVVGPERNVAELMDTAGVPVVAPYAGMTRAGNAGGFSFYLLPGPVQQVQALVEYGVKTLTLDKAPAAILHPDGGEFIELARSITQQGAQHGWTDIVALAGFSQRVDMNHLARTLSARKIGTIFHFGGPGSLARLMKSADRIGWRPVIMLPGTSARLAPADVPPAFSGKVFIAFPTRPSDHSRQVMQEFVSFHRKSKLSEQNMAVQVTAYASAKVLMEALKRAGKHLNRRKLIESLEKLSGFTTGLTPPLSFGPNRRVGARGAYIVSVDREHRSFKPVSDWISVQ